MSWPTIITIVLLVAVVILLIIVILRQGALSRAQRGGEIRDELLRLRERVDADARSDAEARSNLRREINETMGDMADRQLDSLHDMSDRQNETLRGMSDRQAEGLQKIVEENARQREAIIRTLTLSIEKLQASNEQKLNEMQGVVDRKLDKTLNDRLDSNFARVTEQLTQLYQSLGELRDLSGGVADLNRTLSNVKTRGTWGEVQLQRILEQTLPRSQYDVNVATKHNSDERVEFAIKFPAQDGSEETVWLPIDAKFPSDIYNRIADAADAGDKAALDAARDELRTRIKNEASSIKAKYLDPPRTTNYAFMYLPTEGLYAEVLRIDGLTEDCQKKGVVITGPITITAVLNALQVGFRNVALSKKSVEVMKLLEAVKGQVSRMDEAVQRTQKKLTDAVGLTEDLQKRTRRLTSRMRSIGEIDPEEADRLLGLTDALPDADDPDGDGDTDI